jgi:hypothetical protein
MGSKVAAGQKLLDALRKRIAFVETWASASEPAAERRQYVRYEPLIQPLMVSVVSQGCSIQRARVVDISAGGIRLILESTPRVGEVVRLFFDLGDFRAEVNAEVRHDGGGGSAHDVGLRFTDALVGPPAPVAGAEGGAGSF